MLLPSLSKRAHFFLIAGLFVLNIVLMGAVLQSKGVFEHARIVRSQAALYPEAQELRGQSWDFQKLSTYFQNLARAKGAPYAYEVLKVAPIPPNTDLHLLGHIVGDELYRQQGLSGITVCTQDFRNACSHSIVVGALLEQGEVVLAGIAEACRKAPGGRGAYTMCFHGLGHGVLAYTAYDMEKAVALCQKTGTPEYGNQESVQCISGTVMEIIGGGFHDHTLWAKQRVKYLHPDKSLELCSGDLIPPEAKIMCYTYLTPYLFEAAGADLGNPDPSIFQKAFHFCDQIPKSQDENRKACYGGFGKEFAVLARSRDIRQSSSASDAQLKTMADWCNLAPSTEAASACLSFVDSSLYWGGENDPNTATRFCELLSDTVQKPFCFQNLISSVSFYISDSKYRQDFCSKVPSTYRDACHTQLMQK